MVHLLLAATAVASILLSFAAGSVSQTVPPELSPQRFPLKLPPQRFRLTSRSQSSALMSRPRRGRSAILP